MLMYYEELFSIFFTIHQNVTHCSIQHKLVKCHHDFISSHTSRWGKSQNETIESYKTGVFEKYVRTEETI
jgi:hypothetical protein